MSSTINRRRQREVELPAGRTWLRFTVNGQHQLTVDPARCPRGIHARSHWTEGSDEPVLDEVHDELVVLGQCACVDKEA